MSQQHHLVSRYGETHNGTNSCHRCTENFKSQSSLETHLRRCRGTGECARPQAARLPSTKNPRDKCEVYFRNAKNTFLQPIMVYADVETFRTPCQAMMGSTEVCSENRHLASIGYHAIGHVIAIPEEFQNQLFVDVGNGLDVFTECMRSLCRLLLFWGEVRKNAEKLAMTPEAWERFNATKTCEHCNKEFTDKKDKCRDHDHLTGAFRATLCRACNTKARIPTVIPVGTHNGTNYDNHFFVRGIARLKGGPERHKGIHEFAGYPEENEAAIRDWKLEIIMNSSEKFKAMTFGSGQYKLRFIDTCAFLRGSLAELIEMQTKLFPSGGQHDMTSAFPTVINHHPFVQDLDTAESTQRMNDLMRKIPFPYNGLTGPDVWNQPAVLPKAAYFDDFAKADISETDYAFVQEIVSKCGMQTFREYHDCYLSTDVLALADVFETFRRKFHEKLGVDPVHYVGIPGAALDALLKNSQAHIQLITKESCDGHGNELMCDINGNIRGGLSCMFTPHAKANNPQCAEYDATQPHTWIVDLDVNSLYPASMCMPLPVGEYCKETAFDAMSQNDRLAALHKILDEYKPEDSRGYMLVVGFHVPKELHDEIDFAPPVSRSVRWDELSERQQSIKLQKFAGSNRPNARRLAKIMVDDSSKKLVPDLGHRVQGIHVEHAQELHKLGIRFTSVERVWSYKQACIFKDFIQQRARERGESSDETYRGIVKILMNSLFGKMLENLLTRCNMMVHVDIERFQKAASRLYSNGKHTACRQFNIQDFTVNEDGTTSFLGLTKHDKAGGVVLNTPRMIGWAILEYSKLAMLRLHYNVMKPRFAPKLLMTDTDSLYYLITSPTDPIDEMQRMNVSGKHNLFDLSKVARYKACPNKNKLGCVKFEAGDSPIEEAIFLCAKMYAAKHRTSEGVEKADMKGKGVPSRQLKRTCNFEAYRQALYLNQRDEVSFFAFRSVNHVVKHCNVTRQGLTADNDKVFLLGPHGSRPLGHWRNKSRDVVESIPGWDLENEPGQQELLGEAQLLVSRGLAGKLEDPEIALEDDSASESDEELE